MDRDVLTTWLRAYEEAWRSAGTDRLVTLFTPQATYRVEPFAELLRGLPAIASFWEDGRDGPDEVFTMGTEVLAVEGDLGVVRVEVRYGAPAGQEYRDLWLVWLDASGRCTGFEEWPFWPGHGRSPGTAGEAGA